MVIRIWHPCIVLSCIVIPGLLAKTFSLNEAIAAEERQKGIQTTTRPKFETESPEKISLNKIIRTKPKTIKATKVTEKPERFSFLKKVLRTVPGKSKKLRATESIFPRGKKISSLQYRKTFQIKSPLKPKKLKNIQKARYRRRNQSIKRAINENDYASKKYVPLLRSLSLLFDNILTKADDSFEIKNKLKKYRRGTKNKAHQCTCGDSSDKVVRDIESEKEAVVSTTPLNEVSTDQSIEPTTAEASTATTNRAANGDVSDLGQNTDVPAILPRDSDSDRGDHNGIGKGSSPTFHTSTEGNISGDNGNSERNTGSGKHRPYTKNDEKDPDSTTREHASSSELGRGLLGDRSDSRHPVYRGSIQEAIAYAEEKDTDDLREDRRDFDEFERQINSKRKDGVRNFRGDFIQSARENKHEIGTDETESPRSIQQFVRGDRRFASEDNFNDYSKPEEDHKEGVVDIAHYIASDKRLANGDSASTAEDKKIGKANAAIVSVNDLNNSVNMLQNSPKQKAPFVTIIDGYSVARDKNGANKLAEQSIRFHS